MSEPAANADRLSKHIVIPPMPETLMVISREAEKEEPHMGKVIEALKKDIGIYSAVLQVVNSPFIGPATKITSIEQAAMMLGLGKVASVARSVSIRANLGEPKGLPNFWDAATEVAEICAILTKQLTGEDSTMTYALGMFHSCGVPVMMQGFKDYSTVLQSTIKNTLYTLAWLEKARYGFSNYDVAGRLTEKWFLPTEITHVILLQSCANEALQGNPKIPITMNEKTTTLLALLTLAKYASPAERLLWHRQEQAEVNKDALLALDLSLGDFTDLQNYCIDQIGQQAG